jgi:hypothetical protein
MTTQVVNVRNYKPYKKYWTNPPTDSYVYIGRNVRSQIPFKSKWHNPFRVEKDKKGKEVPGSREKVIRQYREYIMNRPDLLSQIHELKDKTLGCWCKPEKCHGDILAELAYK